MNLGSLPLEMVELVNKITPNEDELKKFDQFSKEKKNPASLAENDRFLYEASNTQPTRCTFVYMCYLAIV